MAHFHARRPNLGTIPDVISRAPYCSFCKAVSDRLLAMGNMVSTPGSCYLQAVKFCEDSSWVHKRHMQPRRASEVPNSTPASQREHPFQPRLPGLADSWDRTTTQLTVIAGASSYRNDGRNVARNNVSEKELIRFQACRTPVPSVADSIHRAPLDVHPLYGGRLLNPNGIGPELPRFWLDTCEHMHGKKCSRLSGLAAHLGPVTDLLLIDVIYGCVVSAPPSGTPPRYAALSYVWGETNGVLLTRDNYATLAKPGALLDVLSLPATIRDAIVVTSWLGIRYLWVDALCIKQDHHSHRMSQIGQMASVYTSAVVTLVAASGVHADAGLSRVSVDTRKERASIINVSGGVSLIPVLDSFDKDAPTGEVPLSPWYSRAWTMQEHLLSARKLIFTERQVYWHCPQANWLEETEMEFGNPTGFSGYRFGSWTRQNAVTYDQDITKLLLVYQEALARSDDATPASPVLSSSLLYEDLAVRYMNRHLTRESDRLNAFTGILRVLSALTGERFVWGLPESRFCSALAWHIPNQPRTFATTTTAFKGEGGAAQDREISFPLPSWSWVAWRSARTNDLHFGLGSSGCWLRDWPKDGLLAEVEIHQIDAAGGHRRVSDDRHRDHRLPDGTNKTIPRQRLQDWKELSKPVGWSAIITDTQKERRGQQQQNFDPLLDRGLLQFWASTATVELCRGDSAGDKRVHIVGDTELASWLWGSGHWMWCDVQLAPLDDDHADDHADDQKPAGAYSPAVAGADTTVREDVMGMMPNGPGRRCDKHKNTETVVADLVVFASHMSGSGDDHNEMVVWVLHALVVQWEGNVAYRIGIATISEETWVRLRARIWKLVTLG